MSTIFNIRNLKLPGVSRAAVIIGALVVVLAIVAAIVGWKLYKKLTTNTVVAYFPETLALYPGDKVQIMGVRGRLDRQDRAGRRQDEGDASTTRTSTRCRPTPPRRSSTRAWWRRAPSSCRRRTPAAR